MDVKHGKGIVMNENEKQEEIKVEETEIEEKQEPVNEEPKEEKKPEPSQQDLLKEIAKLKRERDKASSEAADFKKKWKSTLTEKETLDEEKAEREAEREAKFAEMERTIKINDLAENYMEEGYSKDLAKKMAVAEVDGDTETQHQIRLQQKANERKEWEKEFYKNRPQINAGTGDGKSYSKEQFEAMTMIERTKLRRENPAEYDRLLKIS